MKNFKATSGVIVSATSYAIVHYMIGNFTEVKFDITYLCYFGIWLLLCAVIVDVVRLYDNTNR